MNALKYFDSIASNWNQMRSEYFGEEIKKIAIDTLDIDKKICADLGCGTGFMSLEIAKKANIVFSIDISKNMLKELKGTAEKKGLKNIYPIKGKMDDIPLFDNSVDAAFTNMALHHIVDPQLAILEMYRILKPNGVITITDVEEHNGYWAKEEMFDEWLGFSHRQIYDWLKNSGFVDIEVKSTNLYCKGYSSKGEFTQTKIFIARARKER
ncbi:putative methyltransferase YcgJ [Caloramator mitchellensis]|uniref:Putative methyltransferase YcgJ n=1 Tax=Caloramator mitchellensis TaxID=908809 RepID=A0A0R3JV72_CALMK|nr:class I SAM-dependent methyltransferase [Caloramator mitchellensis]KRQ86173.1 putative methyltransferase YcgJ [Caloramator mitchellensis]